MSGWCTSSSYQSRTYGCEYQRNIKAPRNAKSIVTQIRVDDEEKAEIITRLRLEAPHLTSNRVCPSRLVSFHTTHLSGTLDGDKRCCGFATGRSVRTHASFIFRYSRFSHIGTVLVYVLYMSLICVKLSELSPISTDVTSRSLDPFYQPPPPTCFPAPYPPPPEHSSSHSLYRALVTSFVPPAPPGNVSPLTSYSPDVSSLADLFYQMTVTTLNTDSTSPKRHRMFGVSEFNSIVANCPKEPRPAIVCPPKSTTTVRRRKIASLPTRRGKSTASPPPPIFDSAGATSYPMPRSNERIVEGAPPDHIPTSPQKNRHRHVSTLPSPYTAEAPCFAAMPKSSTPRQRKVHTLRKTLPQSQPIPQNQTLKPLVTAGETFSYNVSRSPPLVSDATSYFDSPPTSSDELDTPPSTPPSSHVLLASTSTESLAFSSEPDRIVSHKEPLGDSKLPYPRQRYRRLDFIKGGLCRDEQPLTFTFSV